VGVLPLFLFFIEGVVLPHFFFLMGFLPLFLFFSEGVVLPHFFSAGRFALFFFSFFSRTSSLVREVSVNYMSVYGSLE